MNYNYWYDTIWENVKNVWQKTKTNKINIYPIVKDKNKMKNNKI